MNRIHPLLRTARRALVAAVTLLALHAPPAQALRVATWNLLGYDDAAVPQRRAYMLQVLPGLDPDIIVVQELLTAPAADSFANLLRATMPSKRWIGGSSTFLLTTQSALYYDSLRVTPSNLTPLHTGGPREVLQALIQPRGYLASAASFRIYSIHFKAGSGLAPRRPPIHRRARWNARTCAACSTWRRRAPTCCCAATPTSMARSRPATRVSPSRRPTMTAG